MIKLSFDLCNLKFSVGQYLSDKLGFVEVIVPVVLASASLLAFVHIGVRAGGLQPPPNIWAVRFCWAMTKMWAEGPGRGFWGKYFLQIKNIF